MPTYNNESIKYIFTDDKKLIQKYIELRENLYKNDPSFKGFRFFDYKEAEDYTKPHVQMLLMFINDRCIGGGCLTISTPEQRVLLPLEEDIGNDTNNKSFLQSKFPELKLENERYCEFNRVVVDPEFRDGDCTIQMFHHVIPEAISKSVKYMYGIGDIFRTRLYKKICISEFSMYPTIYNKILIPEKSDYENTKMFIMMGSLDTVKLPTA